MTFYRVVDTNVAVAANGRDTHADACCQLACIYALKRLRKSGKVILDAGGKILDEYRKKLRPAGQPGVGDFFYKFLLDHQYDQKKCLRVESPIDDATSEYEHFPNDPALVKFDRDDRKFVAVAIASKKDCQVLNALDSDWGQFESELTRNGVKVEQLCPHQLKVC